MHWWLNTDASSEIIGLHPNNSGGIIQIHSKFTATHLLCRHFVFIFRFHQLIWFNFKSPCIHYFQNKKRMIDSYKVKTPKHFGIKNLHTLKYVIVNAKYPCMLYSLTYFLIDHSHSMKWGESKFEVPMRDTYRQSYVNTRGSRARLGGRWQSRLVY